MKFPAYCTYTPTGKLIVCVDGQTFNESTMAYFAAVGEQKQQPQAEVKNANTEASQDWAARLEELKAGRVWLHGTEEEKAEYASLKAKLNQ